MTTNQRSTILTGSITLNVFLIGVIITHVIMGAGYATKDFVKREVEDGGPWLKDRGLVLAHVSNPALHENDEQKRTRVRDELQSALGPLQVELKYLSSQIKEFKAILNERG